MNLAPKGWKTRIVNEDWVTKLEKTFNPQLAPKAIAWVDCASMTKSSPAYKSFSDASRAAGLTPDAESRECWMAYKSEFLKLLDAEPTASSSNEPPFVFIIAGNHTNLAWINLNKSGALKSLPRSRPTDLWLSLDVDREFFIRLSRIDNERITKTAQREGQTLESRVLIFR